MPILKDEDGRRWEFWNTSTGYFRELPQVEESPELDPFDFVQLCQPKCTPEEQAYHRGQLNMAGRMQKALDPVEQDQPTSENKTVEDRELAFIAPKQQVWDGVNDLKTPAPTGERWRAEPDYGDFFYLDTNGKTGLDVGRAYDHYGDFEKRFYNLGNYFATKAQALAVAEAIKQLLELVHLKHPLDLRQYPPMELHRLITKAQAVMEDSE